MPKDTVTDIKIEAVAGKPVELPNGNFIANAEMTRSGMDLHLTGPDGHTIVVEGYFAQAPHPDLVSHDGARMPPAMVNAFLPPEHAGQYAASGQITNDASPAGKITQVVGEAHIIRADGTHIVATAGTPVYQGDVIETSKTGAVNIQFADNTTFAISESARMSVDQFVYHSAEHTGSSFFSMLQGVFVYTSGIIGKTDPGSVNIETPVGSIGIRGTVVAGHILPAGQNSQITIVDGAITLTNGTGTQEMNTGFATVSLGSYQAQPQTVPMDAQTFSNSYHSVSAVAGDTISHFTGTAAPAPQPEHAPTGTTGSGTEAPAATAPITAPAPHAPATTAPQGTAPSGSAAPTSGSDGTALANNTAPAGTTAPAPVTITVDAVTAPPPPASTSTFSSGTETGTFNTAATGTTFTAAPATAGGTSGTTAPPPAGNTAAPPPAAPSGTTGGTTTAPPPTGLTVGLLNDSGLSPTDNITNDGTLKITGTATGTTLQYSLDGGSTWSTTAPSTMVSGTYNLEVRQVDTTNTPVGSVASLTYTIDTTVPGTVAVSLNTDTSGGLHITSNGQLMVTGMQTGDLLQYSTNNGTTWSAPVAQNALPTTWAQGADTIMVRQISPAGNVSAPSSVNFTYDTVAPAAPAISLVHDNGASSTDRITNDNTTAVSGLEGGATVLYSSDGVNFSTTLPTFIQGSNTVYVEQRDQAGNISAPSAPLTFTLDTTAPTIASASNNSTGNSAALNTPIVFTLNFSEALAAAPTAANFTNLGTAGYAIDSIVNSGANQYTVTLHATSVPSTAQNATGTLQMEAIGLTDVAGNALNPSTAMDPTAISISHEAGIGWGPAYTKGTVTTADDGVSGFLQNGTVFAHVNTAGGSATPASYTITVTSGTEYTSNGSSTQTAVGDPSGVFAIDSSGNISVTNYLALSSALNPSGINVTINAYAGAGGTGTLLDSIAGVVQIDHYPTNGASSMSPTIVTSGDTGGTGTPNFIITTGGNAMLTGGNYAGGDILVASGGSGVNGDSIIGNGGQDILIGGAGNDWISVADNTFQTIEGNGGSNTLEIGGYITPVAAFDVNLATSGQIVRNIEQIDLAQATAGQGNGLTLNTQNVFDMTDGTTDGALTIHAAGNAAGSYVGFANDTAPGVTTSLLSLLHPTAGIWGVDPTLTYQGVVNGQNVTLTVQEFANIGGSITDNGGILVEDGAHQSPIVSALDDSAGLLTGGDFLVSYCTSTAGGGVNSFTDPTTFALIIGDGQSTNTLIGGMGDDQIIINASQTSINQAFSFIDGGAGYNELNLESSTASPITLDFSSLTAGQVLKNISQIDLGGTSSGNLGNTITLGINDIFKMTAADVSGNHTLNIVESNTLATGATVNIATTEGVFTFNAGLSTAGEDQFGTLTGGGNVAYTGAVSGHSVTLVIHETAPTGGGHIAIA